MLLVCLDIERQSLVSLKLWHRSSIEPAHADGVRLDHLIHLLVRIPQLLQHLSRVLSQSRRSRRCPFLDAADFDGSSDGVAFAVCKRRDDSGGVELFISGYVVDSCDETVCDLNVKIWRVNF